MLHMVTSLCIWIVSSIIPYANAWDAADFKKPDDKKLRSMLSEQQYQVTQKDDTEKPFKNQYWDNQAAGIYVDIVSGEPLFSSLHQFKSGTGWPSFYQPLEQANIVEKDDFGFLGKRTEVRSQHANSHLGHVFQDGPAPTGLRYCINSAALKFIAKDELEVQGYSEYLSMFEKNTVLNTQKTQHALKKAVFAGGCFWCMEKPFDDIPGVKKTVSGYAGGKKETANYKTVSKGGTAHLEALEVSYDPKQVSYDKLLEVYWRNIDPFDSQGQFCDKGYQYTAAIFYNDAQEKNLAQASFSVPKKVQKKGESIAVKVVPMRTFFPAEAYHQDYYQKHPLQYKYYRFRCGRDKRLQELWHERNNTKHFSYLLPRAICMITYHLGKQTCSKQIS